LIRIYAILFFFVFTASAQNPSAVIATGNQFYCEGQIPIVEGSVVISDPSDPSRITLNAVYIQISSGYERNSDVLSFNNSLQPNITTNFNPVEGKLTLIGPAQFSDFEEAVENVVFENTSGVINQDKTIIITIGDANYFTGDRSFLQVYRRSH
jgi:hypothetical protein